MVCHGDFTSLAEDYAKYRPGYAPKVLEATLDLQDKRPTEIEAIDVGAGTGIWSRLMASAGCHVTAVEPNDAMRAEGQRGNGSFAIEWRKGSAEDIGLEDNSADVVTMASSFHWADFNAAVNEFARILRPGGWFFALWNPRHIDDNPLLVEIEAKLKELVPNMKRVSSGRSEFCAGLTDRLLQAGPFDRVVYIDGRHVERMDRERYLGVWRSVNDIRVQAGPEKFDCFMNFIEQRINGTPFVDATYETRAWGAHLK